MTPIQKIRKMIKEPGMPLLLLFYLFFAAEVAGTVLLLIYIPEQTAGHYVLYAFSAAGCAYFVYTLFLVVPRIKGAVIGRMKRHRFTESLLEDYGFRTVAFAVLGFVMNVAYALFQAVLGIAARSVWNITIAAFYLVLIAMKTIVLFYGRKHSADYAKQIRVYRACGYMLNLLTFALSGIVVLIYQSDMTFRYAGSIIYVVAMYTFYKIIASAIQIFKAKKQDSLLIQVIRNINLISALYSVFVLQVAMYQAFGSDAAHVANAITGGFVAAFILTVSMIMLVRARTLGR